MKYSIFKTTEYDDWFSQETAKSQVQIDDRLSRIESDGHFGTKKGVGNGVAELKWKNGRRIYYALIPEDNVLLLLGGNKNGQSKDIAEAQKILREYTEDEA